MTDNPGPPGGLTPGGGCRSGPAALVAPSGDPAVAAIPRNIAALIGYRSLTERLVCERLGMSESAWARRKVRPELWTLAQLRRVADLLGVDLARLTRVEGP